jgi:serine/threonine protein kinase
MVRQEHFILPVGVTVRDPQGNRFVIEAVLGKGEFGAVYLVRLRDEEHALFALKEVVNPDKSARERFAFESEVLKRLQHEALPRVQHVFENDRLKRVYLLMDYIQGRDLEVLLAEQPGQCFPLPLVLVLMAPIVDALRYLHAQDPPIVHRDIKPANIIVPSKGGEAMLVDFGSAKEYVPGSATTLIGHYSHGYAALEQYRTGTTPATDIYGLGATLYALLTGLAPPDAPSRVVGRLARGVDPLKSAHLLKPDVPPGVAQALQRAMAISSADRFESVEQFWQVVLAQGRQRIHHPPAEHVVEEAENTSWQQEQAAPPARKREASLLPFGLLLLCGLGIACCLYLLGVSMLLLCALGVLLLSLGALLYELTWRKRPSQEHPEAVRRKT